MYTQEELLRYIDFLNSTSLNNNILPMWQNFFQDAKNNPDKMEIIKKIRDAKPSDRITIMNLYLAENSNTLSDDELLTQAFGIKRENIEHTRLESGKEVIKLYSPNDHRYLFFSKDSNGKSLKDQLKEMQSYNQNQSVEKNFVQHGTGLEMVPINDLVNHTNEIGNLSPKERKALEFLYNNAYLYHIEYINIQTVTGVTSMENGCQLYEAYFDEGLGRCNIQSPSENTKTRNKNDSYSNNDQEKDQYSNDQFTENQDETTDELEAKRGQKQYVKTLGKMPYGERKAGFAGVGAIAVIMLVMMIITQLYIIFIR